MVCVVFVRCESLIQLELSQHTSHAAALPTHISSVVYTQGCEVRVVESVTFWWNRVGMDLLTPCFTRQCKNKNVEFTCCAIFGVFF